MAYLYGDPVADGSALQRSRPQGPVAKLGGFDLTSIKEVIKSLAPILILILIAALVWYLLKEKSRSKRKPNPWHRSGTLGGWDWKQAATTRQKHLRALVGTDGYAKVARRLTLLKNQGVGGKALKSAVDQDLSYLRETVP